jgi:SpoVK/Ycf46/Vps4 family AAA+-type ATPase
MVKRIYIPLPSKTARRALVTILLSSKGNEHTITGEELEKIVESAKGYSGADVKALCGEAAMGPVRELLCQPGIDMDDVQTADIRPIHYGDFAAAFDHVRATVSQSDLDAYVDWNKQYGSFPIELQQE